MTATKTKATVSLAYQVVGLILMLSLTAATGCSSAVNPNSTGTNLHKIKPIVQPPVVIAAYPTWFACKTEQDCTVAEGLCGIDQAVNKTFTTQFFSYRDDMERSTGCIDKAVDTPVHTARCVQHRCMLNPSDHQP